MLGNPRTTILGYFILLLILLYVLYGFYIGKPIELKEIMGILTGAATGVGLINSSDGGH